MQMLNTGFENLILCWHYDLTWLSSTIVARLNAVLYSIARLDEFPSD